MSIYKKKLIEVVLPLEAINEGSKPETENPFLKGHPRSIHNWWARTPLSVCRAILFGQLIDDPGEGLPPDQAVKAREPFIDIIRQLGTWDATNDEQLIEKARTLIRQQFGGEAPAVWDMFAGRGSISIEAQRLGLKVYSSDLNPVAVIIQKALLQFPQHFVGITPVNPESQRERGKGAHWHGKGAEGLAEDVIYYGEWVRKQALSRIAHLYPTAKLLGGGEVKVIAWLWARTVKCPNPACGAQMPLVRFFALSSKKGKKAWVEPIIDRTATPPTIRFEVKNGVGTPPKGTVNRRGAQSICCGTTVPFQYLRAESKAGRMGKQLMAIVAEGNRARTYLSPNGAAEARAKEAKSNWKPDGEISHWPGRTNVVEYGLTTFADLFTPRQLVAMTTFSDLVGEARDKVLADASATGLADDGVLLNDGGTGAQAYADAVATYLACALSRMTDYHCALSTWNPTNENVRNLFQRQAIPMAWDFAEANPVSGKLDFSVAARWVADALKAVSADRNPASVFQFDARSDDVSIKESCIISTDPPYYDNIGYAGLSDFFYVWLRRSISQIYPDLFRTVLTPKVAELIASPYQHDGSNAKAEAHFREGFARCFQSLHRVINPDVPMTVYYAFKQTETEADEDGNGVTASTGWETMLEGLISARFTISGTWPVRTTKKARSVARNTNALASAIVIVCRKRSEHAEDVTRRDFIRALKHELPIEVRTLQQENIAPVDMAQASIGPGMAIFTRYSKVLESDDSPMTVKTALQLINQALDEYLSEQEAEFDADTRFAITWFETYGMERGDSGDANTLATARNVSVAGVVNAGILEDRGGKVRIFQRDELLDDWDPATDKRLTIWECTQYLIRSLETESETAAADLLIRLGSRGEVARDLAYRLYGICERKKWAEEGRAYNGLVVAWPEISRLAAQTGPSGPAEPELEF